MNPNDLLVLSLATITSFLVAFMILPVLINFSLKKNLVVLPDRRRLHKKLTPSLGGVAIFAGFLSASIIWIDINQWMNARYLIASMCIIFLMGIRDDLIPFNAWKKMLGQAAAIIVLFFSEVKITSLYGLFGVSEIPVWIGVILTAGFIIIVTNAYNLIDGLDGLAGSLGIVSISAFGIWFLLVGQPLYSLLCFSMTGGLVAFLLFNWQPAEIFMGDTGAMVGGMLLSILTIHFMNSNELLPSSHAAKFSSSVGAAACFIIIPLTDTIRIIILRISRGQSPITPDKNHIHHGLIRLGLSHAKSSILLAALNLLFIGLAFLLRGFSNGYTLTAIVILSSTLCVILDRLLFRRVSS